MTEARLPLAELLEKAGDGDFLRAVAEAVLQLLMEADVEGLIGAARHERTAERQTYRRYHDACLCRTWRPSWLTQWTSGRRRTPTPRCWWRSS
jgi:hypothetical protein